MTHIVRKQHRFYMPDIYVIKTTSAHLSVCTLIAQVADCQSMCTMERYPYCLYITVCRKFWNCWKWNCKCKLQLQELLALLLWKWHIMNGSHRWRNINPTPLVLAIQFNVMTWELSVVANYPLPALWWLCGNIGIYKQQTQQCRNSIASACISSSSNCFTYLLCKTRAQFAENRSKILYNNRSAALAHGGAIDVQLWKNVVFPTTKANEILRMNELPTVNLISRRH